MRRLTCSEYTFRSFWALPPIFFSCHLQFSVFLTCVCRRSIFEKFFCRFFRTLYLGFHLLFHNCFFEKLTCGSRRSSKTWPATVLYWFFIHFFVVTWDHPRSTSSADKAPGQIHPSSRISEFCGGGVNLEQGWIWSVWGYLFRTSKPENLCFASCRGLKVKPLGVYPLGPRIYIYI